MSKNAKKVKNGKVKLVTFWSIISLFTVAFVAIVVILFIESRPFESYNDIKKADLTLYGEELFKNPKANDYYVYIYTSDINNNKIDTNKAEELKPIIFNYFNFVRLNSRKQSVVKIFGFDVNNYNNKSVVGKTNSSIETPDFSNFQVNEADLPMLLRITGQEIDARYITTNDIQKSLQSAMDAVIKPVFFEVIIPKKKEIFF